MQRRLDGRMDGWMIHVAYNNNRSEGWVEEERKYYAATSSLLFFSSPCSSSCLGVPTSIPRELSNPFRFFRLEERDKGASLKKGELGSGEVGELTGGEEAEEEDKREEEERGGCSVEKETPPAGFSPSSLPP